METARLPLNVVARRVGAAGPSGAAPVGPNPPRYDVGSGLAQDPGFPENALLFLAGARELPSQCKWFGAIGTVVVLLSGVSPLFCGVGVRPGFFCTETARGPRRATEKSPPSTQCRDRRRHKMLPAVPDRCFNPPLFQSTAAPFHRDRQPKVAGRPVPKCKHCESQWSSWSSGCLRVKTENRMNERPSCTLPLAGTPRWSPRPGGDRAARHRSRLIQTRWLAHKFIAKHGIIWPIWRDALRRSSRTERCILRELPGSPDCPASRTPLPCHLPMGGPWYPADPAFPVRVKILQIIDTIIDRNFDEV